LVAASPYRLGISSGFRSRDEQQRLYDAYLRGEGNLAAKPGSSNHESGFAIDIDYPNDNRSAAAAAEIVVLTVPHAAQRATVEEARESLGGKILVDATVPLVPPKVSRVQLPAGGSAVAAIQQLLGESVRVVSAFQNVPAHFLKDPGHAVDCDVLVCGDDVAARETVIGLARDIGLRAYHAGPICNSAAAEALTSILIAINIRYKVSGAGIRVTGVPEAVQ